MWFKKEKRNQLLMLIDLENLLLNTDVSLPDFSVTAGFDKIIKQIAQEVGKIVNVFIFAPPNLALVWGETFYRPGFFTILCPKIRSKKGEKEHDTVDFVLTEFGKKIIAADPTLTHICVVSGDKHFAKSDEKIFNPIIQEAIRQGLKIVIIAGNLKSLSSELIKFADNKPDGSKMVYIFSPIEE